MRWEGAAKRSEGSRAWGCKHCRGREEGIWRNRSQCWVDTEYVTVSANRSAPFPANEMSPLEQSTTFSWIGETLWLLVLPRALKFFSVCGLKLKSWSSCIIEIIYISVEIPLYQENTVVNLLEVFLTTESLLCSCGAFLMSPLQYQQWQGGYHT